MNNTIEQLTEEEALAILESELPTIDSEYVGFADNMHRFQVTVNNGEHSSTFDYSMGRAHQDKDGNPLYPDKLGVWYCLVLDYLTYNDNLDDEGDCIEYLINELEYEYKDAKRLSCDLFRNWWEITGLQITETTINRWNELFCQANY